MKRREWCSLLVLFTGLAGVIPLRGSSQDSATAELAGKGDVTLVGRDAVPGKPCSGVSMDLRVGKEGGGEINGPVCVTGVPSFSGGTIGDASWTVSNGAISGAVKGESGQVVATFTGSAGEGGVSGTFTTAGGKTGSWRWDGEAGSAE